MTCCLIRVVVPSVSRCYRGEYDLEIAKMVADAWRNLPYEEREYWDDWHVKTRNAVNWKRVCMKVPGKSRQ
jgi:hypothetical protein